ncbi:hypothetical protein KYB31_15200 [Clostridium felsineum]|uniref:BhlA/UviB family holin-like peptide n=1 Tax=Clostridium felsineum TaxID=36839 RepID=UPI00098BE259|nr:BhlA/UviB family holin-like peptide [Clostridium felsineum]MCR3760325.1 hypothetical protein [Clostridium felsineum]URZ15812.1 Bacteriocin UviB [Clostridium felsineum DSM 794]
MENGIFRLAVNQGIWAALFVVLLFYILKEQEKRDKKSEERERNYQNIIDKLTEKFDLLNGIKKDIEDVKNKIFK